MPIKTELEAKEAKHGEKMIELKIRLWTDKMALDKGNIIPKHAWAAGVVRAEKNAAHGIGSTSPVPFNSLLDLNAAIEKVLVQNGITLHRSRKMRKYLAEE